MKKSQKTSLILSSILSIIFIVFTILVKTINVEQVGPNKSHIGFAKINSRVFNTLKTNSVWDKLTDYFMIFALLIALAFLIVGFIQLIKRKNLFKVDGEIITLGIVCIFIIVLYFIFELLNINSRPVLVDGILEASYPSTHTLIICSILPIAALMSQKYIKNKPFRIIIITILLAIALATVFGRLLSGMHWLTDIIGSVILSATMVSIFHFLSCSINKKLEKTDK